MPHVISEQSFILAAAAVMTAAACSCGSASHPGADSGTVTDSAAVCDPALRENVDAMPPDAPPEWREPPGFSFTRPDTNEVQTHFWLPWDYNRRQVYPVATGGRVFIRLRFMVGPMYQDPVTARVILFVDGSTTPFEHVGRTVDLAEIELEDGLGELQASLPADQFRVGLSQVHVYVLYGSGSGGLANRPAPAIASFSVARDGTDAHELTSSTIDDSSENYQPGFPTTAYWFDQDHTAERPLYWWDSRPSDRTTIPVTLRVQADPSMPSCTPPMTDRFAIVSLLDGRQVQVGALDRLMAKMAVGEQRTFQFDLSLPDDGSHHRYEIIQLPGLGRPARLADGTQAPWNAPPTWVTQIEW